MGKRTGQTDFFIIGERLNKKLDFDKIHSEDDYKKALKDLLTNVRGAGDQYNRGLNLIPFIDELFEESDAKKKIEEKQEEAQEDYQKSLRRAQRFHARRRKKSREADERVTAKRTRIASKRWVSRWIRHRGKRADVRGVDTKRRSRVSRKNLLTRRDVRLKNIRVSIDKLSRKHYHDKQGKYVSNPFKKKT